MIGFSKRLTVSFLHVSVILAVSKFCYTRRCSHEKSFNHTPPEAPPMNYMNARGIKVDNWINIHMVNFMVIFTQERTTRLREPSFDVDEM